MRDIRYHACTFCALLYNIYTNPDKKKNMIHDSKHTRRFTLLVYRIRRLCRCGQSNVICKTDLCVYAMALQRLCTILAAYSAHARVEGNAPTSCTEAGVTLTTTDSLKVKYAASSHHSAS